MWFIIRSLFILVLILSLFIAYLGPAYAQPAFKDPNLKAELIVEEGLSSPTSMTIY
jgi:hypothetical protein